MSGKNKREYIHTKLRAEVKFSHPEVGELGLHTGDISDGGAYIFAEGHSLPNIGECVEIQVQGIGGDAPALKMRIVRLDNKGIGLEFVNEEDAVPDGDCPVN
ncbi:MAG: PilZ domain-containing protein [Pseudomonadales bacterium]